MDTEVLTMGASYRLAPYLATTSRTKLGLFRFELFELIWHHFGVYVI